MKNILLYFTLFLLLNIACILPAHSQAFRKGSILLKLSEGSTHSVYSVGDGNTPGHFVYSEPIKGVRDPLSLEYGISNRWGIGVSSGSDIFYVNPNFFYGTGELPGKMKALTSEFTFDLSYHFYVSQKNDLSLTASYGSSSVSITGSSEGNKYQYIASGNILRFGLHAHHYFYKRMGVLAMLSTYSSTCSPENVPGNTFGKNCSTTIKGYALEFGFCFRLRH